jgi:hypothetical protein
MVKMSRMLTLLSALLLVHQSHAFTAEAAGDFVEGVVVGLEKSPQLPGDCYRQVFSLLGTADDLLVEVEKIFKGDISAIGKAEKDFVALKEAWASQAHKCDFSGLVANLKTLARLQGWEHVFKNYIFHKTEVDSAFEFLANCPNAWFTCGRDVGTLVRVLSGWQLI